MADPARFRFLVSSDWSECLSPNGPFDALIHAWPELEPDLDRIFRSYTANEISLSRAVDNIRSLLPSEFGPEAMDGFLREKFASYKNLSELIRWCGEQGIAFMINTTGPMGYFQRALCLGLIPWTPLLSAHPFLRYQPGSREPERTFRLLEIEDKGKNTEQALQLLGIAPQRAVVIGDSGGDGPHFQWAADRGAFRVGCMSKGSLNRYCAERGIGIHARVGPSYAPGQARDPEAERGTDLRELASVISGLLLGG